MEQEQIEQGMVLRLEHPQMDVLVLSRAFFNRSGLTVVCPVVSGAKDDALHIPVTFDTYAGAALLEQLRSLDLHARFYKKLGQISYRQIQDISDAVQDIFDYYPYGKE